MNGELVEQPGRMAASDALGRGEPDPWMAGTEGTSWPKFLCFCEKARVLFHTTSAEILLDFFLREKRDLTWQLWGSLMSALPRHLPGKVISFMGPYYSSVIT